MPTKRSSTELSASPAAPARPSFDGAKPVKFPVVLPYGAGPGPESLAPLVDLELIGPGGRMRDAALIDTGADTSAFPVHWMKHLGILKKDCRRQSFSTACGTGKQWRYEQGVRAIVLGRRVQLAAIFSDCPVALLGRDDFLMQFKVSFDQRKHRFTLEPY